jgi:hypothetical protein
MKVERRALSKWRANVLRVGIKARYAKSTRRDWLWQAGTYCSDSLSLWN